MSSRKAPHEYETDRFRVPADWSRDPNYSTEVLTDIPTWIKESDEFTLYVEQHGRKDSWKFRVVRDKAEISTGDASSRLAAMRKAELHIHLIRKGLRS